MKTYSVKINDPYEKNIEDFFHKNSVVFSKKPAEGGVHYLAEMTDAQKMKLLKRFKSVIVSLPEMICKVDEDELPFPQPEPDSPDNSDYKKPMLYALGVFVVILIIGFIF